MTDESFIAAAESACFAEPWTKADIHTLMEGGYCIYEIIPDTGYALGRISFDEAELYRIAVLPDKRRRRAGTELLERFIGKCRERGASKVFLEVRSKNTPAVSLYEKHGFTLISTRKRYYGDDDALIYQLDTGVQEN